MIAQAAFREAFVDQILNSNGDLEQLLFVALIAFIALILFRTLSVVADAVVGMVSSFMRVMVGTLMPLAFILLLIFLFLLL